ncbi:MAG TPA: thrombospondin type 3 repeat-containing protein, partial [bacterium]|nr:thrombospondin type 3 repeat-containing protein [bacterium]
MKIKKLLLQKILRGKVLFCPYDSNQLQEDRDNNKVGDVCDDIDQDGVFDAYDNCVETHNPDQKDWNDDEIGDACQDSDNDGVLDIDDNCPSNPNSDRADYDEDGVGDVCDNCPFLSNPGQEDSEVYPSGNPNPDGVGDACDNCINRYNPVVHNPLPYQELFSAKYSGASYLALTSPFYGYFSPDRKYYIWQPDYDLDGKGDACDFENSSYTGGFFYSQITDVKGKSELPKHYPVLLTPVNRSATVKLKMPVNSGESSPRCLYGCPVAVHYCAIDHQKKNQGFWGQDGYCSTTEKTDNPLYKNTDFSCDFGFSHGSDDFNDLAVRSWRKRISIWRESFDWLEQYAENPEDDDARHYLPMNPNSLPTEREWYWRRDWYAEKECYREENENNPLCKNLRNAGSYNEEFTMYYTLSTSVMNTPLDSSGKPLEPNNNYAVYDSQEDRFEINPSYFRADNIYTRAFRYGQGGSNTGMMKLNYYKRFVPEIPPEIDIPEIEYCNTCYLNIARQFAFGEDGMPLPEAEKDNLGRWSFSETVQGGYNFSAQQFYLPENMNIIAEVGDQNMIAVTTRSLDATAEHELRFNTSASGADWNKIGVISNWDSSIQSVKSATERDGILYFIGLSDNVLKLIKVIPPDFVFMISNVCDTPYPVYTIQEFDVPELVEDNVEKIKMMEVAGSIYLIGTSRANEAVKTYKITENNTLMEIEGLNPPSRNILNTGKAGKYIFLTGGEGYLSESMTDIWRFDTESEEWAQVPFSLVGDFRKAITQLIDGKLVIANPIIDGNITHPAFTINNPEAVSVSEIIISYIDIPVTEVEYIEADTYCLNETGNLIKG